MNPEDVTKSQALHAKMLDQLTLELKKKLGDASVVKHAPQPLPEVSTHVSWPTQAQTMQLGPGHTGATTTVAADLASLKVFGTTIFEGVGPGTVRPPLTARPLHHCLAPFMARSLTSPVPLPCQRAGV